MTVSTEESGELQGGQGRLAEEATCAEFREDGVY